MSEHRIAAGIEYCGRDFHGWQCQATGPTLQEAVERALSRVADAPIRIYCAGRTDAGVHARQQVIHFDPPVERKPRAWILGSNVYLPAQVSVVWAKGVSERFHARHSALERSYQYVILNRSARPGLLTGRVAWECRPLDEQRMQAAAQCLRGEHDFSAFRAVNCQAPNPIRNVKHLDVRRREDFLIIDIRANGFLHHMVRNVAGVLMMIGMGQKPVPWAQAVLDSRDRRLGGVTAPAAGLYLAGVRYPSEFGIPGATGELPPDADIP
ncbi:MAG: tRNA pseudouridine(38-40) synthase TruA [Gammaproteobacteria bacterium RIFCSPLOWO2_02_FULL_61_13]|nr:MAG: tRNA pseudouridine(38-40) synthase TruA [Gammaproteobacteria bacterium RIFCSPLOWO2_02_FULL_61_13]